MNEIPGSSTLSTKETKAQRPEPFEGFFEREHLRLQRAMYLVSGDMHEAEELMQDAFLRVWERWDEVGRLADPTGYLYRVAMNALRSRYRRTVRAAARAVRLQPGRDAYEVADDRDMVVRALAKLHPRQRAALVLTELLEYRSGEAAEVLGVKPVTVRVLASQARAALKKSMEEKR